MFLQKINIIHLYNNNRNRETFKTNKTYFYSFQHGVVRQRRVVFYAYFDIQMKNLFTKI